MGAEPGSSNNIGDSSVALDIGVAVNIGDSSVAQVEQLEHPSSALLGPFSLGQSSFASVHGKMEWLARGAGAGSFIGSLMHVLSEKRGAAAFIGSFVAGKLHLGASGHIGIFMGSFMTG